MSVDHFLALGMTDGDAQARAALVSRVARGLDDVAGVAEWQWFVPGRIEVFGRHTGYAGGRSLVAAVPRGFAIAARPRFDGLVRVFDVRNDHHATIDPADDAVTLTGWASYVQVVARRLAANFPGASLGVDLALASDLPRAAGLSSSSALVVGIASALARRAALTDRPEWRAVIDAPIDLAWYLGCVENGLEYRSLAGTAGVGTHAAGEDHTAILATRHGHVSQFCFTPVSAVGDVPMPDAWTFVIASSGVHADKAGSVKDRFNRAALAARALLSAWNASGAPPATSLAGVLAQPGGMTRLVRLVKQQPADGFAAADLLQRLEHFMNEDARVPAAAHAFAREDADALGELADDSQRDADESLGNQVPETRALAAVARREGALAACSFGAGYGGSVWSLVAAPDADRFAAAWRAAYAGCCPKSAARMEVFIARPGPPAMEVT